MSFNSYIFLFCFLPLCLLGWYGLNKYGKYNMALGFLTLMSLWFYGYFNPSYLLIMVASVSVNYFLSFLMDRSEKFNKVFMVTGALFNLGLLFYYKYYDFFIENVNAVFKTDYNLKHILLPLGISFFTFQQFSFIIERGRKKIPHCGPAEYAAFVTFFPQLVAGPIVLYEEMIPQFRDKARRSFNADNMYNGIGYFVMGLAKKVLLADVLAIPVNYGFDNSIYMDAVGTVLVMTAYTLQLYFDFSGYSDMAIGLGLMFNLELPVNFKSPYKSSTLKELWERWHMTLTRFLRNYVYIPLGGNRKGKARKLFNIFAVFVVSGIWHGASWNYIIWGILTGIIVIWNNLNIFGYDKNASNPAKIVLPEFIGRIITPITFAFLLIPFRSPDIATIWVLLRNLTKGWTGNAYKIANVIKLPEMYIIEEILQKVAPSYTNMFALGVFILLCALGIFICSRKNTAQIVNAYREKRWFMPVCVLLLVYCIISFSQVSTFIYFNF
ncbi:MAG: MBOAT family protein [Lachnospiraceae bacterium]|nr:MBOAT family protein [Lachnospiraceae bacterium]